MQKYLTTCQKDNYKPALLKKQDNKCLFCRDPFVSVPANDSMKTTFEHLDNNVFNNRLENLALAHKRCNNEKRFNPDYQIIAKAQLQENHNSAESVDMCIKQSHEPKATSTEIDINVAFYKITKDFISERLLRQGKPSIEFNDTAYSVAYLMKEQTNHGSSATAKRYIMELCSTAAPFNKIEEGGIWCIIKRT